ncbi:glycerophosphodiester phosphodiesterase [Lignipirellula cremea]|uniref:Putative glycerophosphoryl diester phosphodiesterase 1 n=1 Tax=Lignipirellula cremea TaxID=2528010 RepID=A0A518DS76_9BACT|nr:glycerophosphodiester phosphodiesterase [Lignipirellula cremea]QDU94638.1 putative glycerophosphoryl diester phosphodiesterase 1 [Lignipirellula cremea]
MSSSPSPEPDRPALMRELLHFFRQGGKSLALTDGFYKLLALILLTPLLGLLFRISLLLAGKSVLADQDILFFFLGPVGWCVAILTGAVWLGILAIEQAALLAVLQARTAGHRFGPLAALRTVLPLAWPVLQLTGRIVAWGLLAILPFAVLAGLTWSQLLTEFDINYYLQERPPAFWQAIGIGLVLLASLGSLLLWMASGWCFALPLVIFEQVAPSQALGLSSQRTSGQRLSLLFWFAGWTAVSLALSTVVTWVLAVIARILIPGAAGSVFLLVLAIGLTLAIGFVAGLAVNLFSTISLAALLFGLYRRQGGGERHVTPATTLPEAERAAGISITGPHVACAGVLGLVVAIGVGASMVHGVRLEDEVIVIAHRGASAGAPENTLAALQLAIDEQADWVEIDVQETSDGEVVVVHDSDFMKLAGENLKVWDATLSQLQQLDLGSRFSPDFAGESVPSLAQALDLCQGKVGVVIELKYYGHDEQLEQRVIDLVEARGMGKEVKIMSLKLAAVQKMKQLRPAWDTGLLLSVAAGDLQKIDVDFLAVNARFANRRFIQSAHRHDRKVYVWTVDDCAAMSTLIGRGVDGVITNRPATAQEVLQQRQQLSPPERLLLELAEAFGVSSSIGQQ